MNRGRSFATQLVVLLPACTVCQRGRVDGRAFGKSFQRVVGEANTVDVTPGHETRYAAELGVTKDLRVQKNLRRQARVHPAWHLGRG